MPVTGFGKEAALFQTPLLFSSILHYYQENLLQHLDKS